MRFLSFAAAFTIGCDLASDASARLWSNATGDYTLEAELVAIDDTLVVLSRADGELAAMPVNELSDDDKEYLKSKEATDLDDKTFAPVQTWTLKNGMSLTGKVVDFADKTLHLQRRRGRIFVNDRLMNNLPEFYQQLLPQVVAHEKQLPRADGRALRAWLIEQGDAPQPIHVQGVVVEAENGDEYAVPFFLFEDKDLKLFEASWDEWLAARKENKYEAEEDLGFLLRSLAAARHHDEQVQREIAMMQLNMQAIQAGVTTLWEVTLYPAAGNGGPPLWVVVTGRNNIEATNAALQQHSGYVAGPVRRVSRRR